MTAGARPTAGRGGAWVAAQFVLMAVVVGVGAVAPRWPEGPRTTLRVVGIALAIAGVLVAVWAGRALGRSLTPFPRPAPGGELVERGPYAVVRHPVYSGGLLLFVGYALWAGPVALALTGGLALLWAFKARVEERHLLAAFPAYEAYARRVRHRLVPFVY